MDLDIRGIKLGAVLREDVLGLWLAAETEHGPRTVRTLRPELAAREDARLLFAEELRRIATLPKEWFLSVERADVEARRPWMLTESIEAPALEGIVLEGRTAFTLEGALSLARRVAESFVALAERKQVHAAPIPARLLRVERGWVWSTFRDIRAADECSGLKGRKPADPRYAPPEAAAAHAEPLRAGPWMAWAVGALLRTAWDLRPPLDEGGQPSAYLAPPPAPLDRLLARLLDPAPRMRIPDASSALVLLEKGARPEGAAPAPRIVAPVPTKKPRTR